MCIRDRDTLILLAHACFNPTFYFFYQSGELSMLSLELLAACLLYTSRCV